jgi:hypothetical protein
MDQQDGNVVPVCQIFEDTDVLVVGICFVPSRANALEGIDDYQTNSRMHFEKLRDLFHQSAVELLRHHGEVQRRRREIKEQALDTLEAVFQVEVETSHGYIAKLQSDLPCAAQRHIYRASRDLPIFGAPASRWSPWGSRSPPRRTRGAWGMICWVSALMVFIFFIRKSPFPQNKGADRRPSIHALYTRENVLSLNNPGNIPLGELIAEALNISPEEYHELQQMLDRAMTAWTAMRKITGYGIGSMPTRR